MLKWVLPLGAAAFLLFFLIPMAVGNSEKQAVKPTAASTPTRTPLPADFGIKAVDSGAIHNCRVEATPLLASLGEPTDLDYRVVERIEAPTYRKVVGYGPAGPLVECEMDFLAKPFRWSITVHYLY